MPLQLGTNQAGFSKWNQVHRRLIQYNLFAIEVFCLIVVVIYTENSLKGFSDFYLFIESF